MNALTQIVALFVAATLIAVFVLEAFFHRRQALYPIFLIRPEHVDAVRMWAINIGFYNLCYGLGLLYGLWSLHFGDPAVGRALVVFCCASHVLLALVLVRSEPRLWLSSLGEGLPCVIALVAYAVWH
jgi:putative membrane protein